MRAAFHDDDPRATRHEIARVQRRRDELARAADHDHRERRRPPDQLGILTYVLPEHLTPIEIEDRALAAPLERREGRRAARLAREAGPGCVEQTRRREVRGELCEP